MKNEDAIKNIAEYLIKPRKLFGLTSNSSIRTESQDSSYNFLIRSLATFAPCEPASLGPHFFTSSSVRLSESIIRSLVTYFESEIAKTPYWQKSPSSKG